MIKSLFINTFSRVALALTAVLAFSPLPSLAEPVANAVLKLEISHDFDTGINTKQFESAFAGHVWNDFGLQFDLGVGKHEDFESTSAAGTLHAYVEPAGDLAYGLFLTSEDRRPGNSYFYGAEMAFATPGLNLEGFVAMRDDISASSTGFRIGGDLTVPLSSVLQMQAGGTYDSGAPLERSYAYIGTRIEVADGIAISGSIGQTDQNETIFGVAASITFGRGVPFGRRETFARYPGY
ncbi:hypothetical protein [Pseudooceanicola algae]|uniref:Porin domain-containing protein n=1 Tax=Pseudooceanicola algae TaxID=1537215 RepID=A0A418SE34_9RHOB|nr:hypothetical protein [Pseudooceanicola algae]QPM89621.1 hypothetical protein PSAL_008430 [Pseudooceanicola algae]